MYQKLSKQTKGFTIIEVLIVLAIAGLIMLIVFLAVPALQRNSRNNQRVNDASRMAAAVSECLNNNNGLVASCNNFGAAQLNQYITIGNNQQVTTVGATPTISQAVFAFGTTCNTGATGSVGGGGGRAFTLVFQVETGSGTAGRCIAS